MNLLHATLPSTMSIWQPSAPHFAQPVAEQAPQPPDLREAQHSTHEASPAPIGRGGCLGLALCLLKTEHHDLLLEPNMAQLPAQYVPFGIIDNRHAEEEVDFHQYGLAEKISMGWLTWTSTY